MWMIFSKVNKNQRLIHWMIEFLTKFSIEIDRIRLTLKLLQCANELMSNYMTLVIWSLNLFSSSGQKQMFTTFSEPKSKWTNIINNKKRNVECVFFLAFGVGFHVNFNGNTRLSTTSTTEDTHKSFALFFSS